MGSGPKWRAVIGLAERTMAVAALFCVLGALYWFLIRPAQLHWGASQEEIARTLPDDNLVIDPAFDATRAITVRGRPEQVWPWLVQMGFGRAGFYGYDPIENPGGGGDIRSARVILPQFQNPRTGDPMPLSFAATLQFGTVDRDRTVVWRGRDVPPSGVFIWSLAPLGATHTRVISRIRWRYLSDPMGRALGVFTEFADHVAVRAILNGIRDRVEGRPPQSLAFQGAQIAGWFLALGELAAGVLFVLSDRRWSAAWLLAFGAGLLLFFCLYGPAPGWGTALLPWVYLAFAIWLRRRLRLRDPRPVGQPLVRVP